VIDEAFLNIHTQVLDRLSAQFDLLIDKRAKFIVLELENIKRV
jgi:hypothetical protein